MDPERTELKTLGFLFTSSVVKGDYLILKSGIMPLRGKRREIK